MSLGELLERSNVVKDVESAPVSRNHQIVKLFLHYGPGDRRVRQAGIQGGPVCAVIERVIEPVSRTGKQQALTVGIFGNCADVGQRMFRKISGCSPPGFAKVSGLVDEGIPVVHQVEIDADVCSGGVTSGRSRAVDWPQRSTARNAPRDASP